MTHITTKAIREGKMNTLERIGYLIALILMLLLCFPDCGTSAPVTRTGTVTTITSTLQSSSQSVTVPADATLAVVMASLWRNATNWIAANPVTLGGVNLTTLQRTDEQTGNEHAWLGYLVNPATGSQTLAWNWGAAPTEGVNIAVVFYKGVVTSNPVVSSGEQLTTDTDLTGLIAGPDDMMVGVAATYTSAPTVTDSGQTQLAVMGPTAGAYGGFAEKLGATGFYFTGGSNTTCAAAVFRGGLNYSNGGSITIPDSGS